jgi:hypothetical protein
MEVRLSSIVILDRRVVYTFLVAFDVKTIFFPENSSIQVEETTFVDTF